MAAAAINGLRNVRRERGGIGAAYEQVDRLIATQFGRSSYVTGQFGRSTSRLACSRGSTPDTSCRSSCGTAPTRVSSPVHRPYPWGWAARSWRSPVRSSRAATASLFYTDGITESKSRTGEFFGRARLVDYLVRATLEGASVGETVRRLSANVLLFVDGGLKDDATMFLIECRVQHP